MNNKKNYSIWNLIPFVIGSVIGIGAYFKIGGILNATGGNAWTAIITWVIAIIIVASSLLVVTELVSEKENEQKGGGILHVVEKYLGTTVNKFVRIYIIYIYFPTMLVTYSVVGSDFLLGGVLNIKSNPTILIIFSIVILSIFVLANSTSIIFGKIVQTSSVLIKVIPLILLVIIGLIIKPIFDSSNIHIVESFTKPGSISWFAGLSAALPAAMFALDGWQFATSLSTEIKGGSKKLVLGLLSSIILIGLIYILYTIGGLSIIPGSEWVSKNLSIATAFSIFFKNPYYEKIITIIITISAFGALNGLTIFHNRIIQSTAQDGVISPVFAKKDKMFTNASLLSLFTSCAILILITITTFLYPSLYSKTAETIVLTDSIGMCSDIFTVGMFSIVYILISANFFIIKKKSDTEIKSLKLSKIVYYFVSIIMFFGGVFTLWTNFQENKVLLIFAFVAMIIMGLVYPNYKKNTNINEK